MHFIEERCTFETNQTHGRSIVNPLSGGFRSMKTTENTICLLERYTRYEPQNIQILNPCYTHTYYKDHGVEVGNLSVNCH